MNRISKFDNLMNSFPKIQKLNGLLLEKGFFTAPASRKFHGAYDGGLFDHSLSVAETLINLTINNNLKWGRPESPYIVGMFHDLCKIDSYIVEIVEPGKTFPETPAYAHNNHVALKGHGEKSVMILSTMMQLTEEEVMCIRYHMGAFTDQKEWNDYTRAVRKFPNVLWTHQADMIAAHVKGV